jgi:nitrile hydratase
MTCFGPINPEPDEPRFHADWERRVFAFTLAMGAAGGWNIDMARHARELLPALRYWSSSYFEIWLAGLLKLMQERGLVTEAELNSGEMMAAPKPVSRILKAAQVASVLAKGGPADRPSNKPAKFQIGDRVRTRNMHPAGHTRLPRYARGRLGEIALIHGAHVFPDSSADGKGDDPHWLYTVRFSAQELWGQTSRDHIHIDLWEPYLEPA